MRAQTATEVELDVRGLDAALANALRRVMLDEVATIAVDKVVVYQNTSVIPDETLAHRLGLLSIDADPAALADKADEDGFGELNALKFYLKAEGPAAGSAEVLSGALRWEPLGAQQARFPRGFRPLHAGVPLLKLGPGQQVELEAYCTRGVGARHAKWSPVATAYYRLFPAVALAAPIAGAEAAELVALCPARVFELEESGGRAVVAAGERCTACRACVAHPAFGDRVELLKEKDHYVFVVESVGVLAPLRIFAAAVEVLRAKAAFYLNALRPPA